MSSAHTCTVCVLHTETTFHVEGMDCHEEVAVLDRKLKRLRGLEAMRADVVGQRLHVAHDATVLTVGEIVAAVGETGMRAWLARDTAAHSQAPSPMASLWPLVLAGAALLSAGAATLVRAPSWIPAIALVLAIVLGGQATARRAWRALRLGVLDMNVLMSVAVVGALALGDFVEATSVVLLFALSQVLETRSMERVRRSVRALMSLTPGEAVVRRAQREISVPLDDIVVGDLVVVRPGARIPVDGEVVSGASEVNEAPVTGESLPVRRAQGDAVFAGTVNGNGALEVHATRPSSDSTLARVIHLVEHAHGQRAQTQTFVERFARIYTPAVIAAAVVIAIVPPLVAGGSWLDWTYRALVMLVIACPCALVISTPVAIVSALTAAARRGVLVKGGVHLERLARVRCMAFDKTGTLTEGRLAVHDVSPWHAFGADDVLRLAGSVEQHSGHLVGQAIAEAARAHGLSLATPTDVTAFPGSGVDATVDGQRIRAGSPRHFDRTAVWWDDAVERTLDTHRARGWTTVLVERAGALVGAIALGDRARAEAPAALASVRRQGVRVLAMLTGDHPAAAAQIAAATGIDEVHADLMPDDKMIIVGRLRERHGPTAMVGDGVNDAPALALADVGIAMGAAGTDAALETADVALMGDDLLKLPYLLRLARRTLSTIHVNVAFALVLKLAFLVLAAVGISTLWMAILADTGASLLVIANSLTLVRLQAPRSGV